MSTEIKIDEEAVKKLLLLLENDMDALGWDVPPRLYAISGTPEDPHFDLLAMINGHPVDAIRDMFNEGRRAPDYVLGLALTTEGWRHLSFDEYVALDPTGFEIALDKTEEKMIAQFGESPTRERLIELAKDVHNDMQMNFPRPSELPADKKVEIRNTMAILRDGSTLGVLRDRGKEPQLMDRMGKGVSMRGRVPAAMYSLLTGIWDPDDED